MVKLMNITERARKLPIEPDAFPKKKQNKPQPLKVVHFSNPMRVTTTATAFRAVVQKLTGRDSDIADVLARQPPINSPSSPAPAAKELRGEDPFKLMTEEYFAEPPPAPPCLFFEPPPHLAGSGGIFGHE